jgi:arylsulfatase A-like enzyme
MGRLSIVVPLALVAAIVAPAVMAGPPNVLIIVTDDQRAADTLSVMPKTRRYFQRQGVEYPNGFAVTPLCCPSRSTIFSGRYAHNTGVHSNDSPDALDLTTVFPRLLREAGYQTALVGKFLNSWPVTSTPPYFAHWALGGTPYRDPTFNLDGTVQTVGGYSTTRVGRYSVRFLRHFEADDDAPWMLYVAPHAPHNPWTPEARYRGAPLERWRGNPAVFERDRSDKPPFFQDIDYSIADGREVRRRQLRTLMSVDDMVGTIFSELGELRERGRTLAFFLSDNGYLWADHHLGGDRGTGGQKRLPYTPSVRVPLLIRWPRHLPAGSRDTRLTGTPDIAPTVLGAAGVPPDPSEPPLDGRSLLDPDARDHILFEYWRERPASRIPTWASIRTREYQYIEYYDGDDTTPTFLEYYDLVHDPWQLRNLLGDGIPNDDPDVTGLSAQLAQDRVCEGTGPGSPPCP